MAISITRRHTGIIFASIFLLVFTAMRCLSASGSSSSSLWASSGHRSGSGNYAYATFLSPAAPTNASGIELSDENHYLMGARMMIYQLLHDPVTRTTNNIPIVVMVTEGISQDVRDQLVSDGARVVEVPTINIPWIVPGRERWKDLMSKLHVFRLTDYEKVLLLDTDVVVVKPLDDIFHDPAAVMQKNQGAIEQAKEDEGQQPDHYIMAASTGPGAARSGELNGGLLLVHPSEAMFNHYMTVAGIEGRFSGNSVEQDLLNYVHRWEVGNMPWKQLDRSWIANHPSFEDYENGAAAIHEKYWGCARDRNLRDVLLKSRWKMEGFFGRKEL